MKIKLTACISLLLSGSVFAETQLGVVEKKEKNVVEIDYSNLDISLVEIEGEELLIEDEKIRFLRDVIEKMDKSYSSALIEPLHQIEGMYKVTNGKEIMYITENGKYIIPTIAKVEGKTFTDIKKKDKEIRYKKLLSEIKDNEVVTYAAIGEKRETVYIFSDYTCPYCRKLHENLLEITSMGVEVKYIPYPRNGFDDKPALLGLQKIMCSANPRDEYELAFSNVRNYVKGLTSQDINCFNGKQSLHKALLLGNEMDIYGTPMVFTKDGEFVGTWGGLNTFRYKLEGVLLKKEGHKWE